MTTAMKNAFPQSDYTPNGYIDNPYHTRNLNPSGVLRTSHHVGLGWWYPAGRIDDGDNMGAEYLSSLLLAFKTSGKTLVTRADYDDLGIELVSRYHSKNILSYDFAFEGLDTSATFFLKGEHTLLCRIEITNNSDAEKDLKLYGANHLLMVKRKWWGSDGLAGYYLPEQDAVVQTIWAYGDQFAFGSTAKSAAQSFTKSETDWIRQIKLEDIENLRNLSSRRKEPLFGTLAYELKLGSGESKTVVLCLARGVNSLEARKSLRKSLENADAAYEAALAEDDAFWSECPMLTGDWPDHWKHGWVYDLETQRMNSRPPIGIYKHRWDAMQVHEPRVVLGETGIDALMLSYADLDVAKEELYGVFADAPYPNVPCTREDGSMNMIAADGSECGTAPSWCFPFHVIHSVYCRTRDRKWLAEIYPYLCGFIEWWFDNRTDSDGWFHCKCSWESGQDGSKRFLIDSHDPGAVSEYVRTVDVEASVAEALTNLAAYASELGKESDENKWREMAAYRTQKVREMFVDGWFRDFDARNNKPIILENYVDIMMMAPVTCGVATPEQIAALEPKFRHFQEHQRFWLEWPSFVFPFSEASWYAGHRQFIADALYEIAERNYPSIDVRKPLIDEAEVDRPAYVTPGVAREFWPMDAGLRGGSENYGWGATLPLNIIRTMIGFREDQDFRTSAFTIAPTIPSALLQDGRTFGITNLAYRGIVIDMECRVDAAGLAIKLRYRGERTVKLTVSNEVGEIQTVSNGKNGEIALSGPNGSVYRIEME